MKRVLFDRYEKDDGQSKDLFSLKKVYHGKPRCIYKLDHQGVKTEIDSDQFDFEYRIMPPMKNVVTLFSGFSDEGRPFKIFEIKDISEQAFLCIMIFLNKYDSDISSQKHNVVDQILKRQFLADIILILDFCNDYKQPDCSGMLLCVCYLISKLNNTSKARSTLDKCLAQNRWPNLKATEQSILLSIGFWVTSCVSKRLILLSNNDRNTINKHVRKIIDQKEFELWVKAIPNMTLDVKFFNYLSYFLLAYLTKEDAKEHIDRIDFKGLLFNFRSSENPRLKMWQDIITFFPGEVGYLDIQ